MPRRAPIDLFAFALLAFTCVIGTWLGIAGPLIVALVDAKPADWLGFAGNVIGGIATLIAALIAWRAVQLQIETARAERAAAQAEARETARLGLEAPIKALQVVLRNVSVADRAKDLQIRNHADASLRGSFILLQELVAASKLRELSAGLAARDRQHLLGIEVCLETLLTVHRNPPANIARNRLFDAYRGPIRGVARILKSFDAGLAERLADIDTNDDH